MFRFRTSFNKAFFLCTTFLRHFHLNCKCWLCLLKIESNFPLNMQITRKIWSVPSKLFTQALYLVRDTIVHSKRGVPANVSGPLKSAAWSLIWSHLYKQRRRTSGRKDLFFLCPTSAEQKPDTDLDFIHAGERLVPGHGWSEVLCLPSSCVTAGTPSLGVDTTTTMK